MGIITLGMMQNVPGPGKKVELDPASIAALLAVYSAFGLLGFLPLRKSRRLYQELQDKVAKEGNYYCCACGTPKKKYYWVHFIFLPLLPWGLIALLFPLKKCQTCGRPYSTITRLPADLGAQASAGSG